LWRDPVSDSSWRSLRDIEEFAAKTYNELCESNGYLVGQTDQYIILCGSRNHFGEFSETIVIPKVLIVKKQVIDEEIFERSNKKRR
jgi:hypothetical protein